VHVESTAAIALETGFDEQELLAELTFVIVALALLDLRERG
jgi:hypothetical protein